MSTVVQVSSPTPRKPKGTPPLRSALYNWTGLAVNGVLSLVLTRILVYGLGNFYYGMFLLASSVVDSCGLLDMGMRATVFRFVTRYRGSGHREALEKTFVSAFSITLGIAGLIFVVTLVLVGFLPACFGMTGSARLVFRWALLLLGVSFSFTLPAQFLGSFLGAYRRFDLSNIATTTSGIVRLVLVVLALHWKQGVVGVAAVTCGSSWLALWLNWRFLKHVDRELVYDWRRATWASVKGLFSFSFFSFLAMAGDHLRFYVDSLVVGRMLGVASVTLFSIPGRLLYLYRQLLLSLASPMMGVMGELDGQARDEELRSYFLRATQTTSLVTFLLGSLLLLDGQAVIRLWMGPAYSSTYTLMLVLLIGYVFMLSQLSAGDLLVIKGKHQLRGWWTIGEGIANLGLSVWLARRYGLIGVALGTTLPMLIVQTFIQPWYALRVIRIPLWRYLRKGIGLPILVSVAFVLLCKVVIRSDTDPTLVGLGFRVIWQTLLFGLIVMLVVLKGSERRELLERFSSFSGWHRGVKA